MRFKIDGKEYDAPDMDDLTFGEAATIFDYSGLSLDQIYGANAANPYVLQAFVHIAYQRGNPKAEPDKIRALVQSATIVGAIVDDEEPVEGDAGPPEPPKTKRRTGGSSRKNDESSGPNT